MNKKQRRLLTCIILSAVIFIAEAVIFSFVKTDDVVILFAYLMPYFIIGYPVLKKSVFNIICGQIFDENFLMAIATVGAIALKEYPEAVFVMLFYQIGEFFEGIAVGKSKKSISSLMELCPDTVNVIRDGEELVVLPEEVKIGEIFIVRPGQRIALDGTVTEGKSSLNTVQLTGESMPRDVEKGSEVLSGCINISSVIYVRADKPYEQSAASRILKLVSDSSAVKAKSEAFISRFAKYYTPAVVICALLIAFVPPIFTGTLNGWIYRALNLLVISCPCALVISVPLSFFAGIGSCSKNGILVKGSEYIEKLAKTKTFVFDKTGTLTEGVFKVVKILPNSITEKELLMYAEAAERFSTHPIASSVREAYSSRETLESSNGEEISGMGVCVECEGKKLYAGNMKLMEKIGADVTHVEEGGTVLYLSFKDGDDIEYLGSILISDTPKATTANALNELKKQGCKNSIMLTGDNGSSARSVAKALGIDDLRHSLLPQDKFEIMRCIKEGSVKGQLCAFVGDGINDAPTLMGADVGISMGGVGSDAAIEASDIVIIDDDLMRVPLALKIAKKTVLIVKENIGFSIAVKISIMLLSVLGLCPIWTAVFADVGVMAIAVLNSLRAMRI